MEMEETLGAAVQGIQAGTQVVRLAGDGFSAVVKCSSEVVKQMASLLKWLYSQTAGQKLIKMGGEIKIFRVDAADMEAFKKLCRKHGIVYQIRGFEDGSYDVMLSSKQMDLINDIMKRLPSMREIEFNSNEIENKAVVTINEDAVKDFEKYMSKNGIYFRRISVSETSDGQRQYSYYVHPESLKFVREYLDKQVANPKSKFTEEKCGAYTGREFAEQNRHVVVVRASDEVLREMVNWKASRPDAGDIRIMDSGDAVAMKDDDLTDFLHAHAEYKDSIWTENYADYLCKPRSNPFPVDDKEESPVVNRAPAEESEAQRTVRILNAQAHEVTLDEMMQAKYPEEFAGEEAKTAPETGPAREVDPFSMESLDMEMDAQEYDPFTLDDPEDGKPEVQKHDPLEEKKHLDQMAELGVIRKNMYVDENGEIKETYEKMQGQESSIRSFLIHDASIQDRLVGEASKRAEAVGQEPDPQAARKGMVRLEMPTPEEETEKRMMFRLYDGSGKEYVIMMRKEDLEVAPNGKRYAWVDPTYDYNIYSKEHGTMTRVSGIQEPANAAEAAEGTVPRPGINLVDAIKRGAAASPQPANAKEAVTREQQEMTGRRTQHASAMKKMSFEETADVLGQQREKIFEKSPQRNDFNGGLNHSQNVLPGEKDANTILCDRKNPQNYIRIHSERAIDSEGETYIKNDYRVYRGGSEVKASEVGHNGRFTDERFGGREAYYWPHLRQEMQEKSGISDDVLEFKDETEFAEYYQKFLGSETYEQLKLEEASQEVKSRTRGETPEGKHMEQQEPAAHRSNAVKSGPAGAMEERKYSKNEADALEAALLGQSRKKQNDVLHSAIGGKTGSSGSGAKKVSVPHGPGRKL